MDTRIYLITQKSHPTALYLVRASSQAQAVRHVVKPRFTCRAAGAEDVVAAMAAGIKVEDATRDEKDSDGE